MSNINAVRCRHNTVNSLTILHNRYPIYRPWRLGMVQLPWIWPLICALPQSRQCCIHLYDLLNRAIMAHHYILWYDCYDQNVVHIAYGVSIIAKHRTDRAKGTFHVHIFGIRLRSLVEKWHVWLPPYIKGCRDHRPEHAGWYTLAPLSRRYTFSISIKHRMQYHHISYDHTNEMGKLINVSAKKRSRLRILENGVQWYNGTKII